MEAVQAETGATDALADSSISIGTDSRRAWPGLPISSYHPDGTSG